MTPKSFIQATSRVREIAKIACLTTDLQALQAIDAFLERAFSEAAFQKGDRVVRSNKPIDFDASPGWQYKKHVLQPGAKGEVIKVENWNGHFVYGVVFDEDSWYCNWGDRKGQYIPTPAADKGIFTFSEDYLRKLESDV